MKRMSSALRFARRRSSVDNPHEAAAQLVNRSTEVAEPATAPGIERGVDAGFDAEFLARRFPPHKVVVHDNDHTPFDSVIKILLKAVPGMSLERAQALTMEIHTTGAAVPFVGPKEPAEHVGAIIRTIGIKVTVEPDE